MVHESRRGIHLIAASIAPANESRRRSSEFKTESEPHRTRRLNCDGQAEIEGRPGEVILLESMSRIGEIQYVGSSGNTSEWSAKFPLQPQVPVCYMLGPIASLRASSNRSGNQEWALGQTSNQ